MVFLLISVAQMLALHRKVEDPLGGDRLLCEHLRESLALPQWNAEIGSGRENEADESGLDCLTIRFNDPGVLFESGEVALQSRFKEILAEFFPEYLGILREWERSETDRRIREVRIEGHTSSAWEGVEKLEAYFLNMELSQGRTRSVLQYILNDIVPSGEEDNEWVRERVRAVGFSSSQLVRNADGTENPTESRRVLFRVSTNLEEIFRQISDETSNTE